MNHAAPMQVEGQGLQAWHCQVSQAGQCASCIRGRAAHKSFFCDADPRLVVMAEMAAPLSKKGSFSYLQDNVNYVSIDAGRALHIARVTPNVGRMYIVDAQNVEQPLPANMTVTEDGNLIQPHGNSYFISWISSYVVMFDGNPFVRLNNQKQQAISAPGTAASGTV